MDRGNPVKPPQYANMLPHSTLNYDNLINAPRHDPIGFINSIDRGILDEIQRASELFRAIKLAVDRIESQESSF